MTKTVKSQQYPSNLRTLQLKDDDLSFAGALGGLVVDWHFFPQTIDCQIETRALFNNLCTRLENMKSPSCSIGWSGALGASVALAVATQQHSNKNEFKQELLSRLQRKDFFPGKDYSLESGIGGFIWLTAKLSVLFQCQDFLNLSKGIVECITSQTERRHGLLLPHGCPEETPLGLYKGLTGLAYALAEWGRLARDNTVFEVARHMINSLFTYGLNQRSLRLRSQVAIQSGPTDEFHLSKGLVGLLWAMLNVCEPDRNLESTMEVHTARLSQAMKMLSPSIAYGFGGVLDFANLLVKTFPHNQNFSLFKKHCYQLTIYSSNTLHKDCFVDDVKRHSLFYGSTAVRSVLMLSRNNLGSIFDNSNLLRVKTC